MALEDKYFSTSPTLDFYQFMRSCYGQSFERGEMIARKYDGVTHRTFSPLPNGFVISGHVKPSSSYDYPYFTQLEVRDSDHKVAGRYCDCRAARKYPGPCKHMVALAKTYMDAPESFEGYSQFARRHTSEALAQYMQRRENLRRNTLPEASVRLAPTVVKEFGLYYVKLRIEHAGSGYVVKDVGQFLNDLDDNAFVSYGKKLAFAHAIEVFDAPSRQLIELLRVNLRRTQSRGVNVAERFAKTRQVMFVKQDMAALFDLLGRAEVPYEIRAGDEVKKGLAPIADGTPDLTVSLAELPDGGYALSRTQDADVFLGEEHDYVWTETAIWRVGEDLADTADFLGMFYGQKNDTLYIEAADAPLFAATVLPALEGCVAEAVPEELAALKPVPGRVAFYLDRDGEDIVLETRAVYGDAVYDLDAPSGEVVGPVRDTGLEKGALEVVDAYFGPTRRVALSDTDAAAKVLYEGVAHLATVGEVFTTPAFDRLVSDRRGRVQMGLSIDGGLLKLSVSGDELTPAEIAELLASYRMKKRYHRLAGGAFMKVEADDLDEVARVVDDLGLSPKDVATGSVDVPVYNAFYLDAELDDEDKDEAFLDYIRDVKAVDYDAYVVPESLAGTLRPYQKEGFAWLNSLLDMGFGGILADEMGLGKSLQLITLLLFRKDEARRVGPSLVVCPASLVYNWKAEFERFAPELVVEVVEGDKARRARTMAGGADVFVMSYDIARIDAAQLRGRRFFSIVLDEAQCIKNQSTATTKAIKTLSAEHRLALTGTPIENRLSEVWSIFDFLMPGFLGSYQRFRDRFEADIIAGDDECAARLSARISPFILRRRKADVLKDLPEKLEQTVYVPMGAKQKRLYAAREQALRQTLARQADDARAGVARRAGEAKLEVLTELMRLRQTALDPALLYEDFTEPSAKTEAILELIEEAREAGEKVLVFSQFTSYLESLAKKLDERWIAHYTITGKTPKRARLDLVNAFNTDEVPVFLVSLKAGGTGLNLVGASVVIHADPWWNAAATNQATDRAHRIGQKRDVSVYKVIAKDTVEERILKLQEAKNDLAESVVGGADGLSLARMSGDDLLALLEN